MLLPGSAVSQSPQRWCVRYGTARAPVTLWVTPWSRDYVMKPLLSRTQVLEGLAEAQRSWQEPETQCPTSLLTGPWLLMCFSEFDMDALKLRGFWALIP